jgi:hypothetical protein
MSEIRVERGYLYAGLRNCRESEGGGVALLPEGRVARIPTFHMSASPVTLDDLERDAMTELVNIGVSRAAASLRNIRGYIAMLLDFPSLEALRALIRDFISRIVGEGAPAP